MPLEESGTPGTPSDPASNRLTNEKLPISKLPAELLLMIFFDIIMSWDPPFLGEAFAPGTVINGIIATRFTPAIHLSHVCHRWRTLVLGSRSLWDQLKFRDDAPPDLVKTIWANCGKQPTVAQLEIVEQDPELSAEDISIFQELISSANRLRYVQILCSSARTISTLFESSQGVAAPWLDTLFVSTTPSSSHTLDQGEILPTMIYSGGTPELSVICLRNYSLSPDAPILRSPKLARLILASKVPQSSMEVRKFCSNFAFTPLLDTLILANPLYHGTDAAPLASPVYLPRLAWLQVRGTYKGLSTLFQNLRIPACPTLLIGSVLFEGEPTSSLDAFLSIIAASLIQPTPDTLWRPEQLRIELAVIQGAGNGIAFAIWRKKEERNVRMWPKSSQRSPLQDAVPWVEIQVLQSERILDLGREFLEHQGLFCWDNLRAVEVSGWLPSETWGMLSRLPLLTDVAVCWTYAIPFLAYLCNRQEVGVSAFEGDETTATWTVEPFPVLESVTIDFAKNEGHVGDAGTPRDCLEIVMQVLKYRQLAMGKELKKLRLLAEWADLGYEMKARLLETRIASSIVYE